MAKSRASARSSAIAQIEAVFEDIATSLNDHEPISIPLKRKPKSPAATSQLEDGNAHKLTYLISFPGKTPEEARRFTVLIRILELVHEALISNTIQSKRLHTGNHL